MLRKPSDICIQYHTGQYHNLLVGDIELFVHRCDDVCNANVVAQKECQPVNPEQSLIMHAVLGSMLRLNCEEQMLLKLKISESYAVPHTALTMHPLSMGQFNLCVAVSCCVNDSLAANLGIQSCRTCCLTC